MADYKKNDIVKGKVSGIESYGVFIKFDDGYTGLIHISEISDDFVDNIKKFFTIGEVAESKVIEIDKPNKRLKLSTKYRIVSNNKMPKIEEVGSGFDNLKKSLNKWIDEKKREKIV